MLVRSLACGLIAIPALITMAGCGGPAEKESAENGATAASIDRVTAGRPTRKTLSLYTSQPGRIEAFEETPLYPKIAGYVEQVMVDIGDPIAKGQSLIKLSVPEMEDDKEQRAALVAQAEAEVRQAEAALVAARAAVNSAQARVSQAEAGIGRAEGEYARWQSELERMRELASRGSVTQKLADETLNQFRAAESARNEASANVQSATADLRESEANVVKAEADHVASQARLRVANANLTKSETLLGYTEIKAPYDGVVTGRNVDTGHYVHPSNGSATPPLLTVASTEKVRVFVDVPEMEAPLVDGGDSADSATIRIQSLGNRSFEGKVTRTSWALDGTNRSLRTELDIPNEKGAFRPGMYATVKILLEERKDVLTLPITAIIRHGEQAHCYCVESGKIVRRPITLGLRSGDEIEIRSGLDEDATVVLARADSLQDGQQVEVIEAEN